MRIPARKTKAALAAAAILLSATASAMTERTVRLTDRELVETPASPLLHGHFIEVGYGIQVEPMRAEMLWNPSMEAFVPYTTISITWFDLWHDPRDHNGGFETDWRVFDWHHSGYEHNAWFAAPGPLPGYLPIDNDSTFLVEESPDAAVRIIPVDGGAPHGERFLRISNAGSGWGGLAQEGKHIRAGIPIEFRGLAQGEGPEPFEARVALFQPGDWSSPIAEASLGMIGAGFEEKHAVLDPGDYEGWAVFAFLVPGGHGAAVDAFSLRPVDHLHGWRPEVVEAARRVNPTVLRVPGGCFASFHDWRDSIGPRLERVPRPSWFWGGLNSNEVGIAEFVDFARLVDAEPMYCLNMFHPLKREWDWHLSLENRGPHGHDLAQFADIEHGIREAQALVAYSNAGVDHPMGALRASHGHPEPFGIQYWELDNETHRWMQPLEYAELARRYALAMKEVDPSIKVGMITYSGEFEAELDAMLAHAGEAIDFMADRSYGQYFLDTKLAAMRRANADRGTPLFYANTEWLAYEHAPDAYNMIQLEDGLTPSYIFSKWRYALNVARNFIMFSRAGGELAFVNFNNFANTHAQSVIETPREGVWLAATGRVFELLSRVDAAWALATEGHDFHVDAMSGIAAFLSRGRESIVLQAYNMTDDAESWAVDLGPFAGRFGSMDITTLSADGPAAMNTLADPDAIRREDREGLAVPGGAIRVDAPAWSFVVVVLR